MKLFPAIVPALLCLAMTPRLSPLTARAADNPEEIDVQVNVLGNIGQGGKFDQANITREENRVIQAPFGSGPGSSIDDVAVGPDKSLYFCGLLGASQGGNPAFVARVSPDGRKLLALRRLPGSAATARRLSVSAAGEVAVAGETGKGELFAAKLPADLSAVLWTKTVSGDVAASVAIAPDGSVVVCPNEHPFVSRISADGTRFIPFGSEKAFRTDAGNPKIHEAWWVGCGYVAAGYKGGATYHRGGSGGVAALPDGTFVLFTTNFLKHPGGGPDFDPMLLRFNADGEILWCTNLLEGLPAESDHKQARLALDPFTGDLLLAAIQHGHFSKNLVHTPGAYLSPEKWFTGDIMIGWVARADPLTGKVRAATYFFPEVPGPPVAGKRKANSLFPRAVAADSDGNLIVAGRSAYKFETTLHAFQSDGSSGAFLAVFTPDLGRLKYASLIQAPGHDFEPAAVAAATLGPVVVGGYKSKGGAPPFEGVNADTTDFLSPRSTGASGGFFSLTPSAPWLE